MVQIYYRWSSGTTSLDPKDVLYRFWDHFRKSKILNFVNFLSYYAVSYPANHLTCTSMTRIKSPPSEPSFVCSTFNCGFFLHKKRSRKRMLEGLRLFLLRDYLHFKWWIMVFTSFRIDERFLILFVHIFVSPGSLWSPLRKTKEPNHIEKKKKAQSGKLST